MSEQTNHGHEEITKRAKNLAADHILRIAVELREVAQAVAERRRKLDLPANHAMAVGEVAALMCEEIAKGLLDGEA